MAGFGGAVAFWVVAIVVFIIVAAVSVGLVSIWFALGAAAALCTALLHGPIWLQIVWFFVISVVTLILTRPLAKKYINARTQPTNADRSLGQTGVVTEEVDNVAATGAVSLDGKVWTARSYTGEILPVGARVTAREIQGVKLIVERSTPDTNTKEE